jgi:threonyl-tRNA synthetase
MVPVNQECEAFCKKLADELHAAYVRVEVDTTDNSFNKKIRNSTVRKTPITLIIGNKEVEEGRVTVRRYGIEKQEGMTIEEFKVMLHDEIKTRKMLREPMSALI